MRIVAIIFLPFFIVLLQKVKVHIEIHQRNFDGVLKGRIAFFRFERKIAIVAREKRFMKKRKKKHSFQELWKKVKKAVMVNSLSIKLKVGLSFMPVTAFAVLLLSTVLETLKYQKIPHYSYLIQPDFGNVFSAEGIIDLKFQIRICDIISLYFYYY